MFDLVHQSGSKLLLPTVHRDLRFPAAELDCHMARTTAVCLRSAPLFLEPAYELVGIHNANMCNTSVGVNRNVVGRLGDLRVKPKICRCLQTIIGP